MQFGVITNTDIENELLARGITVTMAPPVPDGEDGEIPDGLLVPPDGPEDAIVVVGPRDEIDYDGKYIPIYPTPVITEMEEEEEEILPPIPNGVEVEKGINKWLLVVMGVAVFALIALGGQQPVRTQRRRQPSEPEAYSEEEEV